MFLTTDQNLTVLYIYSLPWQLDKKKKKVNEIVIMKIMGKGEEEYLPLSFFPWKWVTEPKAKPKLNTKKVFFYYLLHIFSLTDKDVLSFHNVLLFEHCFLQMISWRQHFLISKHCHMVEYSTQDFKCTLRYLTHSNPSAPIRVNKTEFLLTISMKYQEDEWWEQKKI